MNLEQESIGRIHQLIDEYNALQRDFDLAIKTEDADWEKRLQEHKNALLKEIHMIDPEFGKDEAELEKAA